MARLFIVLTLALLLSVSPILSSFATYICCCSGARGSFHLHHQEHAHHDNNHSAAPAPTEASRHSADDDGEHHHGSHHGHDADQASGVEVAVSTHAGTLAPDFHSCSEADFPPGQVVAVMSVGKTSRESTNLASGHVASSIKVTLDHLYLGSKVDTISDLSPPVRYLFIVNRSLLI